MSIKEKTQLKNLNKNQTATIDNLNKADANFYSSEDSKESPEYHDPLLHLFKLLIKIDQRVKAKQGKLNKSGEEDSENHQRNTNNAS